MLTLLSTYSLCTPLLIASAFPLDGIGNEAQNNKKAAFYFSQIFVTLWKPVSFMDNLCDFQSESTGCSKISGIVGVSKIKQILSASEAPTSRMTGCCLQGIEDFLAFVFLPKLKV